MASIRAMAAGRPPGDAGTHEAQPARAPRGPEADPPPPWSTSANRCGARRFPDLGEQAVGDLVKRSSLSRTWRYRLMGATPSSAARLRMVIWSERPSRHACAAASTTCSLEMRPPAGTSSAGSRLADGFVWPRAKTINACTCTNTYMGTCSKTHKPGLEGRHEDCVAGVWTLGAALFASGSCTPRWPTCRMSRIGAGRVHPELRDRSR